MSTNVENFNELVLILIQAIYFLATEKTVVIPISSLPTKKGNKKIFEKRRLGIRRLKFYP